MYDDIYEAYGPSAVDRGSYQDGQNGFVCEELEEATGCRTFIDGQYCFLEEVA